MVGLSTAATLSVVALVLGCAGDGDALRASLGEVDPSGRYWAIRAECTGDHLQIEFRPGERLSASGLGYASDEAIAVECGDPERVVVSNAELRRRTAMSSAADLAAPTFAPTELSCVADDGPLVVEAHPVWAQYTVVGGALRVELGGKAIVDGAILTEESNLPSQLRWWRAACRRVG